MLQWYDISFIRGCHLNGMTALEILMVTDYYMEDIFKVIEDLKKEMK